jgi:tellurite resistance protein
MTGNRYRHTEATMENVLELLFGCCFVMVYAWGRYNTPDTNRSSTTQARFFLCYFLYAVVLVVLYWLFTVLIQFSPDAFIRLMQVSGINLDVPNIGQLNSPITTALIFTTLFPSIPLISRFDKNILYFFWSLGEIPSHVLKLAARLNRSNFYIHPAREDEIKEYARRYDINTGVLVFSQEDSPVFLWTKACSLILKIEGWKNHENQRYRRCLADYENQFEEIKGEFGAFGSRLSSYEKRLEMEDTDRIKELREDIHEHLMNDGRALVQRCCNFIAHAVLMVEISEKDRIEALKKLGFEYVNVQSENLTANQIVLLWVLIFVGFFAISILEKLIWLEPGRPIGYSDILFVTLLMSVNYGVSAFAGIYPKTRWRFANIEVTRSRPYWGYLYSGVLATVLCLLMIIALRFTKESFFVASYSECVEKVFVDIGWSYPYLFQSFVLAFMTAFVADNEPGRLRENTAALRDAGIVMAALVLISLFSYAYMHGFMGFEGTKAPKYRDTTYAHIPYVMMKAIVVGLLVGYLVPVWYRGNKYRTPLDAVIRWIDRNNSDLKIESMKLNRGELVQALVTVNAAITIADGHIDEIEKELVRGVMNRLSEYEILDLRVDTTMKNFMEAISRYQTDNPDINDIDLSTLKPLKRRRKLAELVAQVAFAVGHADGVFDEMEEKIYDRIVQEMNVTITNPGAGYKMHAYAG